MATLEQVERALVNADAAGDTAAATALVQERKRLLAGGGMAPAEPPERSLVDKVVGGAKAVGSGMATGLSAIPGLPGDVMQAFGKDRNTPTGHRWPTTEDITKYLGVDYAPQSKPEEYIKSAGAGVAGMLPQSRGAAVLGGLSGLAGQGAEDLAPGEGSHPWARAIASLGTLLLGGSSGLRKPNTVKAAESYLKDLGPGGIEQAADVAKTAGKELGTNVALFQGIPKNTTASAIAEELLKSPQGEGMRRVLDMQAPVGENAIAKMIAGLKGLEVEQSTANRIMGAGSKALQAPRDARRELTKDLYDAAKGETIPPESMADASQAIKSVAEALNLPPTSQAGAAVRKAGRQVEGAVPTKPGTPAGRIVDERGNPLIPEGLPEALPTPALSVKTLAREKANTIDKLNPTSQQINQKVANDAVHKILAETAAPEGSALKAADQTHQMLSEKLVRPVEESGLTTMFPAAERTAQYPKGDYKSFSQIFDSTRFGPKDVAFAADHLNSVDSAAWPSIVRQNMEARLKDASKIEGGRPSPDLIDTFTKNIYGGTQKEHAMFAETMKGVGKANGLDPNAVAQGATKVMEALEVISRDRGSLGQINVGEFSRAAGANMGTAFLKSFSFTPTWRLGSAVERAVRAKTYSKLAEAFTSPNGAKMLQEMAQYDATSQRVMAVARALTDVNAVAQSGE